MCYIQTYKRERTNKLNGKKRHSKNMHWIHNAFPPFRLCVYSVHRHSINFCCCSFFWFGVFVAFHEYYVISMSFVWFVSNRVLLFLLVPVPYTNEQFNSNAKSDRQMWLSPVFFSAKNYWTISFTTGGIVSIYHVHFLIGSNRSKTHKPEKTTTTDWYSTGLLSTENRIAILTQTKK